MASTIDEKKAMLGLNICYYRKARSMTQTELAEQLEITSNYLSQVPGLLPCGKPLSGLHETWNRHVPSNLPLLL